MQDGCIVKTAGSQTIDGKGAPPPPVAPSRFVYHAGLARLPIAKAPNFLKSHRITAQVEIPPAGAEGVLLTNGGRVLGVTATAQDLRSAVEKAYTMVQSVQFDNAFYRHDIGQRALKALEQ